MIGVRLLLVLFSFLLLAAHFLRSGDTILVAVALLLPALLLSRRRWAARTLQVALLLGVVEWVRTLIDLVALRASAGQPVLRLALILGGVTLLTGLAAVGMPSAPLSKIRGPARMRSNADG